MLMPKVVFQKTQGEGQYRITIPLSLIKAMNIKAGDKFEFKINKRGNMELVKEG